MVISDVLSSKWSTSRAFSVTCFGITVSMCHTVTRLMCTYACVNQVSRNYPGFLRVFLQDPQPDRRFMRRGWLTFDHTVNIKEICWNLNNIRVNETVGA